MFDSIITILSQYIDSVSRYNIYSVEMQRGENPEDLYFLCHVDHRWYIVFETDYIGSLSYVVKDINQIFGKDVQPLHWLTKKADNKSKNLPLTSVENKYLDAIILRMEGYYLKHAVLEVEVTRKSHPRYDPNSYGQVLK